MWVFDATWVIVNTTVLTLTKENENAIEYVTSLIDWVGDSEAVSVSDGEKECVGEGEHEGECEAVGEPEAVYNFSSYLNE